MIVEAFIDTLEAGLKEDGQCVVSISKVDDVKQKKYQAHASPVAYDTHICVWMANRQGSWPILGRGLR
jgi:hypothetical protein